MTTHLLDTNAWLRTLGRSFELNATARALVLDAGNAPFAISAMSVWEVCTKFRKRPADLGLQSPLEQWLASALQPSVFKVLPMDAAIARESNSLPGFFHEDPADRVIVATARIHDLILLTSDENILAYPHVRTLDTR